MNRLKRRQAVLISATLLLSVYARADMKVKLERHYSLVGGPPGIADSGSTVEVCYVQGNTRRTDVLTALASRSGVIRHCDSGEAYYLDFDHKQYWEIPTRQSKRDPQRGGAKSAPASSQSGKAPKVTVRSRTVETGKSRVLFGHVARQFVTTAKEFLGDSDEVPYAEETIDAWYWSDVRPATGECVREDLASQPSRWIGEPEFVPDAVPDFQHSGPTPTGLTVEETRTVRSKPSKANGGWESVTTIGHKVVEFSDSPLDPSLFQVPNGFRKVPHPKFAHPSR